MEITTIVGMGLATVLFIMILKQQRPEFALQLSVALTVIIFMMIIGKLAQVLELFQDMAVRARLNPLYLHTLLKIIGIAYITEFGAAVCRDAGESAIAAKIEFAGKVLILTLAIPIVALVLDTIVKLLQ